MATKKKDRSYFLIQIDHASTVSPEGIATSFEAGSGCYELKVLDVDGFSKKQHPYIAE